MKRHIVIYLYLSLLGAGPLVAYDRFDNPAPEYVMVMGLRMNNPALVKLALDQHANLPLDALELMINNTRSSQSSSTRVVLGWSGILCAAGLAAHTLKSKDDFLLSKKVVKLAGCIALAGASYAWSRPRPVHDCDNQTSGLLKVVAEDAYRYLESGEFEEAASIYGKLKSPYYYLLNHQGYTWDTERFKKLIFKAHCNRHKQLLRMPKQCRACCTCIPTPLLEDVSSSEVEEPTPYPDD